MADVFIGFEKLMQDINILERLALRNVEKEDKYKYGVKVVKSVFNAVREVVLSQRLINSSSGRSAKWCIDPDGYYPYCSNCKKEPNGGYITDYCPSCGAAMYKK